jgi:hypothetical protein
VGHIRLGTLPKSRKWNQVVGLIADGADVEHIAAASADAAESVLDRASDDIGLAHAFWLLTQIPLAARQADFPNRLRALGLDGLSVEPTLIEIIAAFGRAVDRHVHATGRRTDLGEMAQHAASETLASLAGRELPSLFGPTAADVQLALGKLGTSSRFSLVARDFFSRLTNRSLGYFLSRELSTHVGPTKRFAAIGEHSEFNAALDLHCRQASRIIKEFSGGWYGKTLYEKKEISQDDARKFARIAFKKLRAELRKRSDSDG